MRIRFTNRVCAAIATVAILGSSATALFGQEPDTVRVPPDTLRRIADSTGRLTDSARVADAPGRAANKSAASKETLRGVGKVDGPVRLSADLSEKRLTVIAGNNAVRTFRVAIGTPAYPTPPGTYRIRKIVWNPSWIPPDAKWARGKTAKGPGEPGNPMKVAKIFFREPDYYIHGTAQVNSLGTADSHGCLRMSPDEVAELAQFLMENGGQPREEGWFSRIVHLRWKTHTITLSEPVLLTVSP